MAPGLTSDSYRIPSAEELDRRRTVGINAETVTNITSTDFPHHYPGEDNSWNLKDFRDTFKVQFHTNPDPLDLTFSLIGIDASVANAFRRILLSEVPSLAIEYCYIYNNTSIVQDEVLANRLGLVPLRGSKRALRTMAWFKKPSETDPEMGQVTDNNTIVLALNVECTEKPDIKKGATEPTDIYDNAHVYAKQMVFQPVGRQVENFKDDPIVPVNPDILLAKMRGGQAIDMELHCIKGIGADHAKFSPVATATYRLMPRIDILRPILGEDAKKFARCFPPGVVGMENVSTADVQKDADAYGGHEGELKAVVRDPMRDTISRECLRHEEFKGKVKLGRVKDHFIFSVESTGQFDSDELFVEAVKILSLKCRVMKRHLTKMVTQ